MATHQVQVTDFAEPIREALAPRAGFTQLAQSPSTPISLPPWFIDRCRNAYLTVPIADADQSRVVGVSSAQPGDGKTSVAIGIATAMAADTQRPTALFECDLERPSLYRVFGFERDGGLSDWLEGTGRLRVLRSGILANAFMIPAGAPHPEPARLFHRLTESDAVAGLRTYFPNVVIDLPPIVDIAYSALAQKLTEHILLVARVGRTLTKDLEQAICLLGSERVTGIVLNGTDHRTPGWLRRLL